MIFVKRKQEIRGIKNYSDYLISFCTFKSLKFSEHENDGNLWVMGTVLLYWIHMKKRNWKKMISLLKYFEPWVFLIVSQ